MGKITNIVENGIAGLVSTLEFRSSEKRPQHSPVETSATGKKSSFISFIFGETLNRKYLLIAVIGTIVQFVVFKMLYPFPDFISDSYSYIATNIYHMDVNLWPIGYSKFLLWIHMISHSDIFLVSVQYFLLEVSLAYFFFSILYLYRPGKSIAIIIYLFLFFNPLFLYLSNAILSDSLFAALTTVFFTQFLWMLDRPTFIQVIIQGVIIGICFTIRYTAIYYPLISLAGLLLSKHCPSIKLAGFLLGVILMIPFYIYTCQKTKEATGTAEFSVFGGWQIANNALYMYNHIEVDSSKLPVETRSLDRLSRQFFKQVNPSQQELSQLPGTYFIKVPYAILKPYMIARYTYDNPRDQFATWGKVSPIYNKYGTYLITHHPIAFSRYYLWMNVKNYFLPHLEKFSVYNLKIQTVPTVVQDWFHYITPDVFSKLPAKFQGKIFYIFPMVFMFLNIYFGWSLIWLIISHRFNSLTLNKRLSLYLTIIFLVVNFAFSVFATPVVLRYQVVPLILLFTYSALLFELPDTKNVDNRINNNLSVTI